MIDLIERSASVKTPFHHMAFVVAEGARGGGHLFGHRGASAAFSGLMRRTIRERRAFAEGEAARGTFSPLRFASWLKALDHDREADRGVEVAFRDVEAEPFRDEREADHEKERKAEDHHRRVAVHERGERTTRDDHDDHRDDDGATMTPS